MMNMISSMTYRIIRTYSTRRRRGRPEIPGLRGKLSLAKEIDDRQVEMEIEDDDPDDTGVFESDFSRGHESYMMHERETERAREMLRRKITVKKYFKTKDPSFLTLIEREEMIKLHNDDPEQWNIERLSDSFPALPETIAIILKNKWKPRTVERVLKFDQKIAENWKKFHAGKLIVSPQLREHLSKFGERKIPLADREILAKRLVMPKVEFPEPKTKVFSTIVDFIEGSKSAEKQQITADSGSHCQIEAPDVKIEKKVSESRENNIELRTEAAKQQITADSRRSTPDHTQLIVPDKKIEEKELESTENNIDPRIERRRGRNNTKSNLLTFNEFVEQKCEEVSKSSEIEGQALLETYKNQMKPEVPQTENVEHKEIEKVTEKENELINEIKTVGPALAVIEDEENSALSTYVAKWKIVYDKEPSYFYPIKIPKAAYQRGKIYRIADCYYDSDGEFLYRVPGLRS